MSNYFAKGKVVACLATYFIVVVGDALPFLHSVSVAHSTAKLWRRIYHLSLTYTYAKQPTHTVHVSAAIITIGSFSWATLAFPYITCSIRKCCCIITVCLWVMTFQRCFLFIYYFFIIFNHSIKNMITANFFSFEQ